nr:hypothetical protein [Tanacetum cinerariifolium]
MIHELKGKFNGISIEINQRKECQYLEQVANLSTISSQHFNSFCYDDDDDYDQKEITIPLNGIISLEPLSNVITTSPLVLPTKDLEDSLIMGNEELNTIPEKESDEFTKSSVEDLVPIPKEKSVTFSNPLFNLNDDFISSNDESLSDEDVPEDNVLEEIECKDSYDPNLDESDLLVTPLFDPNEDECLNSGGDVDEINDFADGHYDLEGDILYLESLLSDDTTPNLPPEIKGYEWIKGERLERLEGSPPHYKQEATHTEKDI